MLAALKRAQMGRLAVGGIIDHVAIGLEQPQTEQPIEVRRLLFRRNAEPDVIGIEICRHYCFLVPCAADLRDVKESILSQRAAAPSPAGFYYDETPACRQGSVGQMAGEVGVSGADGGTGGIA